MDTSLAPEEQDEGAEPDPYAADGPLAAAYAMCQEMALPLPPLPEALLPLLQQVGSTVFTSRAGMDTLANRAALVAEAAAGELIPFIALGYEGYGTNNWALRYYVVLPPVALFVELPFGGAYTDPDAARLEITQAWQSAEKLLAAALTAKSATPYVIEHRGLRGSRWCTPGAPPQWHDAKNALDAVTARLSAGER
jgi:hypothetical protein